MTVQDWVIVGGGIHGVHIAAQLIGNVGSRSVRIVDPAPRLLDRWKTCTARTHMSHLRSPSVHHIGLDALGLRRFSGNRKTRRLGQFAPPYNRPSLELFNAHCEHVIESLGLDSMHVQDRVQSGAVRADGVTIQLAGGGSLATRHLVLAVGSSEQPDWPDWAPRNDARIQHIFDPAMEWPSAPAEIAVIGGGITAGQTALRLVHEGHRVKLIARHALREHQFDSDPGWLGPKFMIGFRKEPDMDRRRAIIAAARHRGSMPPDVRRALRLAVRAGRVECLEGQIHEADLQGDQIQLCMADGARVAAHHVMFATGCEPRRPGGALVDDLAASAELPCAACGYPIVDRALRWHPRIFVTGPLAELELGPTARNIAGARRAGERIARYAGTLQVAPRAAS